MVVKKFLINKKYKSQHMETLSYNGKYVKSITLTDLAKSSGYSNVMVINNHVIKGISKDDCQKEFEHNREKYDDCTKNTVEYFLK